jgi:hypothetical protein
VSLKSPFLFRIDLVILNYTWLACAQSLEGQVFFIALIFIDVLFAIIRPDSREQAMLVQLWLLSKDTHAFLQVKLKGRVRGSSNLIRYREYGGSHN